MATLEAQLARLEVILEEESRKKELDWTQISSAAKLLADSFLNNEIRTKFGQTRLIESSSRLLGFTLIQSSLENLGSQIQLLRVIGNLCFDHDVNRAICHQYLLASQIIQVLATNRATSALILPMKNLRALKSAAGALLNLSMGSDLIKTSLLNPESLAVLASIINPSIGIELPAIYTPGSWSLLSLSKQEKERLQTGSTIVEWCLDILASVLAIDNATFPSSSIIPLVQLLLSASCNTSVPTPELWSAEEMDDFVETDVHLAKIASTLLEKLAQDLDSIKKELALERFFEKSANAALVDQLLDFIEIAAPEKYWKEIEFATVFSSIKACAVRTVIELPNDDLVMKNMFKNTLLVKKLVKWIQVPIEGREDLIICAAHMLGALSRNDEHSIALIQEYHIASPLASILFIKAHEQAATSKSKPGETAQILFGLVSLLRHLAIPVTNRIDIAATGVMHSTASLLRSEFDIISPLQAAAIAVLKHLLNSEASNSFEFIRINSNRGLTSNSEASTSVLIVSASTLEARAPLAYVLELLARTDDVRLRSEGTRVLINAIRATFATKVGSPLQSSSSSTYSESERVKAREELVRLEVVKALCEMVRTSSQFPMLVNEAVVGLTLLASSSNESAELVLHSLLLSKTASPAIEEVTEEQEMKEMKRAFDVLSNWFKDYPTKLQQVEGPHVVRVEMMYNALLFMMTITKIAQGEEMKILKDMISKEIPNLMESFKLNQDLNELPFQLIKLIQN